MVKNKEVLRLDQLHCTSSVVLIEFNNFLFNPSTPSTSSISIATTTTEITEQHPDYFAAHSIKINGDQPNILVCVSWFQKYPLKGSFLMPLTVW